MAPKRRPTIENNKQNIPSNLRTPLVLASSDDDENQNGKNDLSPYNWKWNKSPIMLKFRRLSDKSSYKIINPEAGGNKKKTSPLNNESVQRPRRSCVRDIGYYNEEKLFSGAKHEIMVKNSFTSKIKSSKIPKIADSVKKSRKKNSPSGKRNITKEIRDDNVCGSEDDDRENQMQNANKNEIRNLRPRFSRQLINSLESCDSKKTLERSRTGNLTTFEEISNESTSETEFKLEDEEETEDSESSCSEEYGYRRPKRPLITCKTGFRTPSKKIDSKNLVDSPSAAFSRLSITPSMHRRTINIARPSTPLQEARLKLHVSVLPKSLPCREEQFNDIYTFLLGRLSDGTGGCIYISGVPGTGKTATVNEVIRCLRKSVAAKELNEFKFVDINGMKLSDPKQAYVQIWKQLHSDTEKTSWEEALRLLQKEFSKSSSKRGMTLLLVDELDLLCTKRQDVVYNLLDWPSKSGAKLVVVTIANTMDLPERILMGKVSSRLGLTRLTFPPYNFKQLEEIVMSRLKGFNAFNGETVQLVARKVAAVSGDARRALDICRRATEVAEGNGREMVTMNDVIQAVNEMIASPKIQAIKHCSDMEKVFLQSVCIEVKRTGVEEVIFKFVYQQMQTLCTFEGQKTPNISEALAICARLGSYRLLLCDHSRTDILQRVLLNISTDDVDFALRKIET